MSALYIVMSKAAAIAAGSAGASCRHHKYPDVRFWWPELNPDALRGCKFDVVTVDLGFKMTHELEAFLRAHLDRQGTRFVVL